MSPGAKVFLTLASIGGIFGVLALAASKKAGAASLPPGGTVVVPPHDDAEAEHVPEPEGGFVRDSPFSVPGIQDAAEASRLLLRWWSSEGQSLVGSDTAPDRPNVPADFGSTSTDLNGSFGSRTKQVAAAFEHYNGLSPEDGLLTNALLLALRRWAESQSLPPEALPPRASPSQPGPIVLPSPSSAPPGPSLPPIQVPLPPIMPQSAPVVPVPPFVPQAQPPAGAAPPALPQALPAPLPPLPSPTLPVPAQPEAAQTPPPGATNVSADTALMVNTLLEREASKGWNTADPTVQAWQKKRGLKVDGLFGPKTALTVAEEFGTVPIIRVWPAGSIKAKALQNYRAALVELANSTTDQTRAQQLRVSAQREQAQGFGPKRGAAPAIADELQVKLAKVA